MSCSLIAKTDVELAFFGGMRRIGLMFQRLGNQISALFGAVTFAIMLQEGDCQLRLRET